MDEPEFSYFAPDRLVGVLGIEDDENQDSSAQIFHLIHLTSRFGAFIRENNQWKPLVQSWNPDPDYKYINFKESSYDAVVRAYDSADQNNFFYDEVKEHQEILDWEGGYDNTIEPFCFRDIQELINWIQDFVEPKPKVITYGRHRVSISDMDWMRHDVAALEEAQAETEAYVLRQRKKNGFRLVEEKLTQIEMYPPLNQAIHETFAWALGNAGDWESSEDFLAEYSGEPLARYLAGEAVSMRELNETYLELLASGFSYQFPLSQINADNLPLIRDASVKPENRLEAWFLHGQEILLYQVIANTYFGIFARYGKGKWQPILRSREDEDIYDLAGVTIVHLRPEREVEIFAEFDAGNLQEMKINSAALTKFRVDYRDDNPSGFDFYDRVNFNDKTTHLYSTLPSVASGVVMDMVVDLRSRVKTLSREEFDVDLLNKHLEKLNAFLKDENELSYYELHRTLVEIS